VAQAPAGRRHIAGGATRFRWLLAAAAPPRASHYDLFLRRSINNFLAMGRSANSLRPKTEFILKLLLALVQDQALNVGKYPNLFSLLTHILNIS
jgi:hypothetical protein